MKKLLILLLLTLLWKSASAQFAVFDGANAVNMGVEIGHSVTQIQKAADMLKRFQQVSTAVSRCNRMRKSLTKALQDLNDCRNMANSVALDKTSARALTRYFRAVNTQISRSTSMMTSVISSGKFSLDDQDRLEKLAQLADYTKSMSSQLKSVTRTVCQRSRVQDNYQRLKDR